MQTIKNIKDENLKNDDIVRYHCPKCDNNTLFRIMIVKDGICGICSKCRELSTLKINKDYIKSVNNTDNNKKYIPKCPTCSSTNVQKISGTAKAVGAVTFGLFSKTARSQFRCNNCGYKW